MEGMKLPSWLLRRPLSSSFAHIATRERLTTIATATLILALIAFAAIATPRGWKTTSSHSIAGIRPYTGKPDPSHGKPPHPKNRISGWTPAERLIVKVKLEDEDVSWLNEIQWIWRNEVLTVPQMFTNLHPAAHRPDKGRIATAYLTWIIENYHHLPETLVMLPPLDTNPLLKDSSSSPSPSSSLSSTQFSAPPPAFDMEKSLRHLQTAFIQSTGFANLQCPTQKSSTTCNGKAVLSSRPSHALRALEAWPELFGKDVPVPESIATVLGAQFAVSRDALKRHSLEDYLKYWEWLNKTSMDDDSAGLVFEYIWPVVFGKDAVFCPDRVKCECDLYGRC